MPVPSQLKQWHAEVAAVKRARPSLSHGEAMQVASQMRRGRKPAMKKGRKPAMKKGKRGGNVTADIMKSVLPFLSFL